MPSRYDAGDYPYAYQGQEKDAETGMEAFELRLWDARIGRWLTTDPAGQFHSPYLGMHNNPINAIDPDGGFSWLGARWFKLWNGGEIIEKSVEGSDRPYYAVVGFGDGDGASIAVGKTGIKAAHRGYTPLVGGSGAGLSLFGTSAIPEGIPDVYLETNIAVTTGSVGANVKFLGSRFGLSGQLAKESLYSLGFDLDTSNYSEPLKNTSGIRGGLGGKTFGGGAAFGGGVELEFNKFNGRLKKVTYSALVSEITTEYQSTLHGNEIERSKVGFNIGADVAFFVGLEAYVKFGIILPNK